MNTRSKRIVTTLGAYLAGIAIGIPSAGAIELELIGRHQQTDPELFDGSAAEIPTYDPLTKRAFVTNAATASIDVIDLSDPTEPSLLFSIPLASETVAGPTSVVFTGGILAVSLVAEPKTDNGQVAFFDADGYPIGIPVEVGALPDAITVSPDGTKLIVCNEGEPNDDNTIDPDGSVSIIDISNGIKPATVMTAGFGDFDAVEAELKAAGVRIFGRVFTDTGEVDEDGDPIFTSAPAGVAQDLEPEFAAVSPDGTTAYVTLQENNAIATVDLASATVTGVVPLGLKDHSTWGNGLDPSDKDNFVAKIRPQKVLGMFMPDAIATYEVGGETYLVTANEGDSRDYDNFSEEIRASDLPEEGFSFAGGIGLLKNDKKLGRLKTTIAPPETAISGTDRKGNPILESVVAYGARSFSIWSSTGQLVFDSGSDFELITAGLVPGLFNASNDDPEADNRSDDKGPEPEGVIVAKFGGTPYAFVTLERVGGIMVYDISDPHNATFVDYINTRLPAGDDGNSSIEDDLGPEGLVFIDPADSPNGEALLVVTNEVSGSTIVFQINP